ncbi:MAG: LacI family DNA-binding transcriptional regulator [Lachnospiraceae bacterium]|nr:LacI family DNA-binding transcriptional regulator [Lachnospiraceae bacterium]
MITIKEMAEIAGVSPTTVANVLHGRTKKVSKDTLQRVQDVIEQSNYVSNMGARLLGNYGSRIIAVVLAYRNLGRSSIVQDPFASSIIGAMEQEISRRGYFMMLYANPNIEECLHMALAWNIEGLILLGVEREDYYIFHSRLEIPIVTVDTYFQEKDQGYANIGLQDYEGGYMMAEYLIRQGHKKIGFLMPSCMEQGTDSDPIDDLRFFGYRDALEKHHIRFEQRQVIRMKPNENAREKQLEELAADNFRDNTALFFAADYLAIEAMNVFYDQGYHIPEDISVVGFDNIRASIQCRPKLTTVQQDIDEKGKCAVEQLMGMIKNGKNKHVNIKLPVQLVIRDTVSNLKK